MPTNGRRLIARVMLTGALAVGLVATAAPAAHAATFDFGRFVDQHSQPLTECPGVQARIDVDFSVYVRGVARGRDKLVYYTEHDRGTRTITNLATGLAVVEVYDTANKDQRVTDNGDGTFTIITKISGQFRTFGPDGHQILHEAGTLLYDLTIDNHGTPRDPSDDVVLSQSFVGQTGQHTSLAQFCAVFAAVTS
jgi:hypothetical protein